MKALIFKATGDFARFRCSYTTTSALTYSVIHPIAVKGLIGAIIREIAGWVKRILDMPAMFVWYFKEENTLRFWRLCGRIEKTRRKETAVTLQ